MVQPPYPWPGGNFTAMGEMLPAIMEVFSLFIQELREIFLRVNQDAQASRASAARAFPELRCEKSCRRRWRRIRRQGCGILKWQPSHPEAGPTGRFPQRPFISMCDIPAGLGHDAAISALSRGTRRR